MIDVAANDGPMAVGFHVPDNFHLYKSGVYQNDSCSTSGSEVTHFALITGYGITGDNVRYWIVKNSWGKLWGIEGYFWIELSKNVCGIMNCPTYPVVHDL
ncbi:uncharacterized protein [Antedon mediterranea]|uniref:uncharacterized protein n=1 Tax=Antedon mediterranea TaxID=105859 RepID=UPI003AF46294